MTLEKHVIDTVKEWQTKIGTDDAGVRLYYPKVSLCGYLKLPVEEDSEKICREAEAYAQQGQFAPGSMLPKVKASMKFAASKTGRKAVICSLEKAALALSGKSGTIVKQ